VSDLKVFGGPGNAVWWVVSARCCDIPNYHVAKAGDAGKWDHTRGASLRTFFIGQCLFQLANVYRLVGVGGCGCCGSWAPP
jgi:hypothetical protein